MPRTRHTHAYDPEPVIVEVPENHIQAVPTQNVQTYQPTKDSQVSHPSYNRKTIPNIYWRALDMDRDLRGLSSRFVGLPPASDLIIGGPDSYRFFRQDSPYWRDFHTGVLSTGCLKEALGFNEPMASKLVGYKGLGSNHYSLLGAYEQLLEPALLLQLQSSAAETVAAANMAALCEAYESSEVARLGLTARQKKQRQSQRSQEEQHEAEGRLRHCLAASRNGISGVRCAWGSLQEASTLAAVMDLFPHASVHEVGMCHVDATQLPTHWGLHEGNLPPLAASPDGIICHPVTLHPSQLQQLQQHCTLSRTSASADEAHYAPHSVHLNTPQPSAKPAAGKSKPPLKSVSTPLSAASKSFNPAKSASASRNESCGHSESPQSELQHSHEAWLLLGQLLEQVPIASHMSHTRNSSSGGYHDGSRHPGSEGCEHAETPSSNSVPCLHGDCTSDSPPPHPAHFASAALCSVGPAVAVAPQEIIFGSMSLSGARQLEPKSNIRAYQVQASTTAASSGPSSASAKSAAAATAAAAMAARLLPSSMARPATNLCYAKALQAATVPRLPIPAISAAAAAATATTLAPPGAAVADLTAMSGSPLVSGPPAGKRDISVSMRQNSAAAATRRLLAASEHQPGGITPTTAISRPQSAAAITSLPSTNVVASSSSTAEIERAAASAASGINTTAVPHLQSNNSAAPLHTQPPAQTITEQHIMGNAAQVSALLSQPQQQQMQKQHVLRPSTVGPASPSTAASAPHPATTLQHSSLPCQSPSTAPPQPSLGLVSSARHVRTAWGPTTNSMPATTPVAASAKSTSSATATGAPKTTLAQSIASTTVAFSSLAVAGTAAPLLDQPQSDAPTDPPGSQGGSIQASSVQPAKHRQRRKRSAKYTDAPPTPIHLTTSSTPLVSDLMQPPAQPEAPTALQTPLSTSQHPHAPQAPSSLLAGCVPVTAEDSKYSAAANDQAAAAAAAAATLAADAAATLESNPGIDHRINAVIREVVEIKNGCPFGERSAHTGGGRGGGFMINDRGPRDMVSAMWVPQLQLHMLASGCASGLLVSRSATKGVRVFRMYRDDPYLASMLSLVSRFYTSHVLQQTPPPVNMFSTDPSYIQFLYRTLQLARRAKEIVCCSDLPLPHGVDDRAFV